MNEPHLLTISSDEMPRKAEKLEFMLEEYLQDHIERSEIDSFIHRMRTSLNKLVQQLPPSQAGDHEQAFWLQVKEIAQECQSNFEQAFLLVEEWFGNQSNTSLLDTALIFCEKGDELLFHGLEEIEKYYLIQVETINEMEELYHQQNL